MELATFGAGCFWGVEVRFSELDGVLSTDVGYMGGQLDEPTYQQVCTDTTGHAEVVQISFDPSKISFEQLLNCFGSGTIRQRLIDKALMLAHSTGRRFSTMMKHSWPWLSRASKSLMRLAFLPDQ